MRSDPDKARAWQQRSVQRAQARARLRPRARLAARSPRRRGHYAAVADACREAIGRDRVCQARVLVAEVRCAGRLDPQHVIPQGVDRSLAADPVNIVAVCRAHHEWIGDHPIIARRLGLHGRYGDNPAELATTRAERANTR